MSPRYLSCRSSTASIASSIAACSFLLDPYRLYLDQCQALVGQRLSAGLPSTRLAQIGHNQQLDTRSGASWQVSLANILAGEPVMIPWKNFGDRFQILLCGCYQLALPERGLHHIVSSECLKGSLFQKVSIHMHVADQCHRCRSNLLSHAPFFTVHISDCLFEGSCWEIIQTALCLQQPSWGE